MSIPHKSFMLWLVGGRRCGDDTRMLGHSASLADESRVVSMLPDRALKPIESHSPITGAQSRHSDVAGISRQLNRKWRQNMKIQKLANAHTKRGSDRVAALRFAQESPRP